MKQLLMALLLTFIVAPSAFAHTQLSETTPANGDVVTTPLTEISLTYAGKIEEGSHFEVTNRAGESIEIVSFTIFDGVLTGTLAQPLPNDDYTVEWDSISADGHPLNGTFSFTVDVPVAEQQPTTTDIEQNEDEDITIAEKSEQTVEADEELIEDTSNKPFFIVAGILVVIIIASLIVLITRRKG